VESREIGLRKSLFLKLERETGLEPATTCLEVTGEIPEAGDE
jgi:hypothetical protein